MDLGAFPIGQFASQGAFALLFVYLLFITMRDSKDRENRLYGQIEKQNEAQALIIQAVERIEQSIKSLIK